jgi:hypothetical protein
MTNECVTEDPSATLGEWLMFIMFLIQEYGEDAVLYTDGGYNNVEMVLDRV